MLLLLNTLGNEFIVWDKAGRINYVKPGRTTVTAEFFLKDDLVSSLRSMKPNEKRVFDLPVNVKDINGDVIAEIIKTLYVRRKELPSTPVLEEHETNPSSQAQKEAAKQKDRGGISSSQSKL
jgi:hypothetical protein